MVYIDPKHLELEDRVVAINRVTKVVKGGRRLRFAALVVVGDKNGHVGFGTGKAQEVIGAFSGGRILMKPAVEGSGVAAGGPVRAVLELAGVADITSKSLGSNTPINVVRATVEGLKQLKRAEEVAELRGKSVEELIG